MDRRTFLHVAIFTGSSWTAGGCKVRLKHHDRQPKRQLLEDRWPGYYFDTVQASYSLKLTNPDTSLSRAERRGITVVSKDQKEIGSLAVMPTIRPTRADVKLNYSSNAPTDTDLQVTVHWPIDRPRFDSTDSTTVETMTGSVDFDDVRRFIDGTGRFRCDDNEHFYGQSKEEKRSFSEYDFHIQFRISGPNPDSRFDETLVYRHLSALFTLAEIACPGLG